jgi:hypothetical protein
MAIASLPLAAGELPGAAGDLRVSAPPRDPLPEAGATSAEGRAETRGDRRKTVGVFKFHMDSETSDWSVHPGGQVSART